MGEIKLIKLKEPVIGIPDEPKLTKFAQPTFKDIKGIKLI